MTQVAIHFQDDLVRRVINPTEKDAGMCTSITQECGIEKIPEPRSYMGSIDACCVSNCKKHVVMFYIDLMNPKAMFVCYDHSRTWMSKTQQSEKAKLVRKYVIMKNKETSAISFIEWSVMSIETHVQERIILRYMDKKTDNVFDFDTSWCGRLRDS